MPDHFFGKVPKKVIDYDYGTMSHMWDLAESYSRSIDFRSINVFFEALVTNAPYLKSLEECIMFMELNPNLFEMNRSVDSFICPSF